MARKVDRSAPPAAPKGAVGADDLDVLHPDREITVGGELVTVREYRFWEGLKLRAAAKPFIDGLYRMFSSAGSAPAFDDVGDLIAEHQDLVLDMVVQSTGKDRTWIEELGDQDGDTLLITWWMVNSGFFIRRLLRRTAEARLAPASRSAGPGSTTPSSPPDTSAASTNSES